MKMIGLIAWRELGGFFGTISGYLILAAHLLVSGLLFNIFAVGSRPRFSQEVLESYFYFSSGMAMVTGVLLGIRLVAEERQTQTFVLLRTSPVSEREIVWGKFLSALIFLSLTLLLSMYQPALIFWRGKVSVLQIGVGYLGLLLLGGASIAVALLASAWSRTQLMAGVVAGLMMTLLLVVWMLAAVSASPLRELFSFLALHNLHFRTFSRGTIHLRDLVYYLGLTVIFLEAAVRSLESWRWRE